MSSSENSPSLDYILPIPCRNKEVYNELNSLIYEYLEVNGLEQALHTFSKECHSKNLPCPSVAAKEEDEVKAAFTHYDSQQLLKSFDEGDLDSFLKLWKQFQTHIQVTSEDMKKLEVYLRVHFAIWPKAKNQPESKQIQGMQQLKSFFEEHSESLSSDPTILPLFALPFVKDPRPHPIFKDLFQDAWTLKLRAQLEITVNKYFELLQENIAMHCKLAAAIAKGNSKLQQSQSSSLPCYNEREMTGRQHLDKSSRSRSLSHPEPEKKVSGPIPNLGLSEEVTMTDTTTQAYSQSVCYHKDRFVQLLGIYKKQRKVLWGVQENYGKLLKVCSILLNSLEKPGVPLDRIFQKCYLTYPDIFTNIPSGSSTCSILSSSSNKQPDIEHFKKLASAASTSGFTNDVSGVSLLFLGINDIGLDTLNYEKIKVDLTSERLPPTEKLCLLQALRWMITKTSPSARSQVILQFTGSDIFGLQSEGEFRSKLFSSFLSPTPTYQKESLSRLVNAFASTWAGRSYLTSSDHVVDTLIQSLTTFKTLEESFICHMVIATLQKLSLRRDVRLLMIEKNVIPWLVKYIKMELDRDLVREEVDHVLAEEAETLSNNNNDVSYGDSTFNTYLMEYAWALLMNLCLHPESNTSALTVDFEFLHCIVVMLTSKFSPTSNANDFIPYVMSTLFSLLRNPELFEKTKTMNLDKKLGAVMDYQPPEIANHMKLLLEQLYEKDNVDRVMALGETEYDDTDNPDPEELETELELQESWMTPKNEDGLLTGDDLLIKEYLIETDYCQNQTPSQLQLENNLNQANNNDTDVSNPVNFSTDFNVGIILRPKTPTRGRTSHTTTLNGSLLKKPLHSAMLQPPPNQLKVQSQTQSQNPGKMLAGGATSGLTPHSLFLKQQQKTVINHLLHPKATDCHLINRPSQLGVTQADQEQFRKESSPPLLALPLPQQIISGQYPLTTSQAQTRILTTMRDSEVVDELQRNNNTCCLNYIRECPLISFTTTGNSTMMPTSPCPKYEKKSILISYLDYEDDLKNNNNEEDAHLQNFKNGESLI